MHHNVEQNLLHTVQHIRGSHQPGALLLVFHRFCPQTNKHATFFYSLFPSCWLWRHSVASVDHLFSKSLQQRHISSRPVQCSAVKIGCDSLGAPGLTDCDWKLCWVHSFSHVLRFWSLFWNSELCVCPSCYHRVLCVEARLWTLLSCSLVSFKKWICALRCEKAKHLDNCRKFQ